VVAAAGAAASIAIRVWTPISFLGSSYDDGWFLQRTSYILRGDWLGPYDQFTLIKGAGYPLFLAAGAALGLSSTLWTALFHVFAVSALAWATYRLTRSPALALLLFLAVLLHPVGGTADLLRPVRDTIYSEQLFLLVAFALLAVLGPRKRMSLVLAALAGLTLGWTYETREESIWLLPELALLLACAWPLVRRPRWRWVGSLVLLAVAGFWVVDGTIRMLNHRHYGTWVDVDAREPAMLGAMDALLAVREQPLVSHVPVPHATRVRLYEISPAMASLKSSLDPSSWSKWQMGCEYYPWSCGDIAGGWFAWALRDAVSQGGHYDSAADAARFYARLRDEIRAACRNGQLRCRSGPLAYVPPIDWGRLPELRHSLVGALGYVLLRGDVGLEPEASVGSPEELRRSARLLGDPRYVASSPPRFDVAGWFYRWRGGWIEARLQVRPGDEWSTVRLGRRDSPDLVEFFHDEKADRQRFEFVVGAGPTSKVRFIAPDGTTRDLLLATIASRQHGFALGDGQLFFDVARVEESPQRTDTTELVSACWRVATLGLYQALLPLLLFAGVVAMLVALVRAVRRREMTPSLVLAITLAAFALTRMAILALVDFSLFPALGLLYMAPANYLAVAAALAAIRAARDGADRTNRAGGGDWTWLAVRPGSAPSVSAPDGGT